MSLSIGIVGLPNVGKSTLFNALTKRNVPAENYPFCTIDPSVGVVAVPDDRLEKLDAFSHSAKKLPTVVEFVDIAGLVKGASEGEGLGNKFLSHIREVDAIVQVVRLFQDDKIIHVDGNIDPLHDIDVIKLELILADLQSVTKRLGSLDRDVKSGKKEAIIERDMLLRVKEALEGEKMAREVSVNEKELPFLKQLNLLTAKPMFFALNTSEAGQNDTSVLGKIPGPYVEIDPVFEKGFDDLIRKSYEVLNLITFFTTGEDETRGWTVTRGSTGPEAGAAIHTDFRDRFIRAEVIFWKDLLDAGSYAVAREKGLVRTEGKEYIVKDGDVIEFKV